MNKVFAVVLALIMVASTTVRAQEEFSEVEYYKKLAEKQLAEAQPEPEPEPEPVPAPAPVAAPAPVYYYEPVTYYVEEEPTPPANAFIAIPQYFHSRNDNAKFKVGSQDLKMSKSHANGAGVMVLYNRRITDWFSLAFSYQHAFMKVSGGMAVPDLNTVPTPAKEDVRWNTNAVGILPEFTIPVVGKLQLSLIQGFDRASGHERIGNAIRDVDDYGTDVTSLMAWWEKDFKLGCEGKWKITPYAGWRSLYVKVKDANDWNSAPGVKSDDNLWVHLMAGGVKVSFQNGPLGVSLRGGVSHRTTRDDIPGYGNRAVAPGVVHFSHRANMDRTVGAVGANLNYVINKRAIVGVGYDATFGKDTSAHMGTLNFIFPF